MIDPFNPLKISKEALKYEVKDYFSNHMGWSKVWKIACKTSL